MPADRSIAIGEAIMMTQYADRSPARHIGEIMFAIPRFVSAWILAVLVGLWPCAAGQTVVTGSSTSALQRRSQTPGIQLYGIDFSPYENGQDPNVNPTVSAAQITARLQIIAPYTTWVRSFGITDGLENIPPIARSMGLKVAAEAWIGTDATQNSLEINNLISAAQAGQVDIAIVGSETLENNVSESQLLSYIAQVRSAIPANVPVSTAETSAGLLQHPNVIAASDLVLADIYPYWAGISISNAVCSLASTYQQIVAVSGAKQVIVAETGWADAGDTIEAAVPSPANAAQYFLQFVSWARASNIPFFYFEAFDEAWKANYEGPQGAHWGIWDENGVLKPYMQPVLAGQSTSISCNGIPGGPGSPQIFFTYVPPMGSSDEIEGEALHVSISSYNVALYIQVFGGWWTKPYWDQPLTSIQQDGTFASPIVTGGYDSSATSIAAFLIPTSYSPPSLGGQSSLPQELYQNSVASVQVQRSSNSISGQIQDANGNGVAGVNIALTGAQTMNTQSAADGKYSFADLSSSGPYTVTPLGGTVGFTPMAQTFANVTGNEILNFVSTPLTPNPSLSQISVATDGSAWGLDSSGNIYVLDSSAQGWLQISGSLSQIAAGSNGTAWGVNSSGETYQWNGNSWTWLAESLSQISAGSDGDVWGVNGDGAIYHLDRQSQAWTHIPGSLTSIAVGYDGAVWGLNSGQIYRYNIGSNSFEKVTGALRQISVGADGDVWGINGDGLIYHFDLLTQNWQWIPGQLNQIAVGSGANVWGVNSSGQVYRFDNQGQGWQLVSESARQISAGADGAAWIVDKTNTAHQLSSNTLPAPSWQQLPGVLAQIAAAPDGALWGINSASQIYTFDPLNQNWTWIPGELTQIAVGGNGVVWGLNSANQIYEFDTVSRGWIWVPGSLSQIAIDGRGDVWGINTSGNIYMFDKAARAWIWVPGSLAQISVGADGTVWGTNSENQIYRFNASDRSWTWIPGSLQQVAVGSSNHVCGANSTGSTYCFNGQGQSWTYLPGPLLTQISVAFDGTLWAIDPSNQIWTFSSEMNSWVQVPGTLIQLVVVSDSSICGVNFGGGIFCYR
jgi:exo-beta-1,3-glucanase (GH17 family)